MAEAQAGELSDNAELGRFELRRDGELVGYAEYRPAGDSVIIAHTEVAEGNEGQGVGSELVRRTLEAIAAQGRTVIPMCPFAAGYVARHPETHALVDPSLRDQFG